MRKIGALSVALLLSMPAVANNAVSKTYLANVPWFDAASPARVSMARGDRMDKKAEGKGTSFEAAVLYGCTSDTQGLNDYFLPVAGKTKLVAGGLGSAAYLAGTVDVVAPYLNVLTDHGSGTDASPSYSSGDFTDMTFQSELSFAPRQKVTGIGLQWQQRIKKFWMKVSAPITRVENDLRMTEKSINAGHGDVPVNTVQTMADAFKQTALKYGKIDGKRDKWGVADVEIMLGKDWIDEDGSQFSSHVGVVVPTGNKAKAEYLWEPIVGNGKHFGVMLGSSARHVWKEGDDYVLAVCCDSNGRYLFENDQVRMLDLQGKPWGRYIWLVQQGTGTSRDGLAFGTDMYYGANILTQAVKVKPRASFSLNTALNLHKEGGFELEVGHNLYGRQAEEVALKNKFTNSDNYGIPALSTDLNSWNDAESASFATINDARVADKDTARDSSTAEFRAIKQADLDLNSAANPAVLQSTVYAVMGMNWDQWKCPGFLGIGGSYSFNQNNASPDSWAVWAKVGLSF